MYLHFVACLFRNSYATNYKAFLQKLWRLSLKSINHYCRFTKI